MGGPAHEVYPAAPADDSGANDPVSKFERRDHVVRQKLIKVETAKVCAKVFVPLHRVSTHTRNPSTVLRRCLRPFFTGCSCCASV